MSVKLLNAATSTGASGTWHAKKNPAKHSAQITITGSPTAVVVDLEGSLDGSTWITMARHTMTAAELTATEALFHVADKPVRHIRVNLVTLTAGTAPTVTVVYTAEGP